jgi:hypothetical protein
VISYPVTAPGARPFIDCPVHGCVVVLGDDGRIRSRCPLCLREARKGRKRLYDRRRLLRKRDAEGSRPTLGLVPPRR